MLVDANADADADVTCDVMCVDVMSCHAMRCDVLMGWDVMLMLHVLM